MRREREDRPFGLRETQRWMASIVLSPDKLDDAGFGHEIDAVIATADRATAIERLRAYAGGYPARISEALAQDHPALAHVLGRRELSALVLRYLPHVPAGLRSLDDVGSALPAFLEADPATRDFPFAPDLARLEQAVRRAFHARELEPFDAAPLAGWTLEDWSAATLTFQPSVAVVRSAWPIHDLWRARDVPVEEIDIDLVERPDRVLVHRFGFQVVCESIAEVEAAALEALLGGASLGSTAEDLARRCGDAGEIGRCFARWRALGLVVACGRAG